MVEKLRSNQNQRSASLPVDDELEAVITTPYYFNETTNEWEAAQQSSSQPDPTQGVWSYYGGASGVVNVVAGQRVIGIAAHATVAGSMDINGGPAVPIPANSGISIQPEANLVAPVITFTGTDSYFVEVVS